jgi:hypothetical protein
MALRCDICGETEGLAGNPFNTSQQLAMHKFRAHGIRKNPPKAKPKPKPQLRKIAAKKPQQHELRELWTDSNGRILLIDEAGDWWVAKKLDI